MERRSRHPADAPRSGTAERRAPASLPEPPAAAPSPSRWGAHLGAGEVLCLQRAIGNRATARLLDMRRDHAVTASGPVLARKVAIGPPGGNLVEYGPNPPNDLAALKATLSQPLAWDAGWFDTYVGALIGSQITYAVDRVADLRVWAMMHGLVDHLATFLHNPPTGTNLTDKGTLWKDGLAKLEAEVATLKNVGDAPTPPRTYSLFGRRYAVEKIATNHYYLFDAATYKAGSNTNEPAQYKGRLTGDKATELVQRLVWDMRDDKYGNDGIVDEFACSFVAESTRWTPEHLFNLLATDAGERSITGSEAETAVPMASGSTWDKDRMEIGRETPRRAIQFARNAGYWAAIVAAANKSGSVQAFLTRMQRSLKLTS